jgi:hypothetical protein
MRWLNALEQSTHGVHVATGAGRGVQDTGVDAGTVT